MFKLVVLSALLAVVAARPGGLYAPAVYTSAVVGHVPTSISHQSTSIVHSAALAAPVLHAPLISTHAAAPIIAAHSAPILTAAAPLISGYAPYHGSHLIY